MIKPQDIIVALDLCRERGIQDTFACRGKRLGMSASEVHAAVCRLGEARLLDPKTREVRRRLLLDFLVHGVPYAFAESPKEVTRGMPTAWAAPVLADQFARSGAMPPIWPDPEGKIQGVAVRPLYRSSVAASKSDPELYDLLALVDALRIGRVRERKIATNILEERLIHHAVA